ncbi:MAG TPA: hypothetical protein VHD61_06725 [Lacunisphaera sp.]|nr:hypothetical protein [Lacunisphaera sp.]
MKSSFWLLVLALGVANSASALLVDFSFTYPQVDLKNGRRLVKVTFKTYDTISGKVGAMTASEAMTVRLADLPDEIAARIKQRVPSQTEEEIKEEKRAAADASAQAKRRQRDLEKRTIASSNADRDAQRKLNVKRAELTMEKEIRMDQTVAAAAREMANHYFKYEVDPNSSIGYVFDSNVLLDDPEPVPGWTNRWRVRGKVGIQYLTRNIGGVGRSTKEFELLIDAPPSGKPKLVDVTISRG